MHHVKVKLQDLSILCFNLVKILCTRYRPRNTAHIFCFMMHCKEQALYQVVYLRLRLDSVVVPALQRQKPSQGRVDYLLGYLYLSSNSPARTIRLG